MNSGLYGGGKHGNATLPTLTGNQILTVDYSLLSSLTHTSCARDKDVAVEDKYWR